jgi:hypothetical protein
VQDIGVLMPSVPEKRRRPNRYGEMGTAAFIIDSPAIYETMTSMQQSLIPVIKSYNSCILLSIITSQALFSLVVALETNTGLSIVLGSAVLLLHLGGVVSYFKAINILQDKRKWLLLVYLFVPLGNLYCIVELSKAINLALEHLGIERLIGFADIKRIEKLILEA